MNPSHAYISPVFLLIACTCVWYSVCVSMFLCMYPCTYVGRGASIFLVLMFSDARLRYAVILGPSSCLTIVLTHVFWIQTLPCQWPSCICVLIATGCPNIWWDFKCSWYICSHSFVRQFSVAKRRPCSHFVLPPSPLAFPVVPTVQCVGLLTCLLFQSSRASVRELLTAMRNKWETRRKEDGAQMWVEKKSSLSLEVLKLEVS